MWRCRPPRHAASDLNATTMAPTFSREYRPYGSREQAAACELPSAVSRIGLIQYMEFDSNSNYHALQVHLTRRFSSLTLIMSYTWSKALDVADTLSSLVNPFLNYGSRNYGPAGFDRRQFLAISYVYMLPGFSRYWNNRFSRTAFDGWELTSISSFVSGAPTAINYTFVTATDVTGGNGVGLDSRVDLTCNPNLSSGDRTFYRAFNTSCVAAPTKAELGIGNASKYPFVGPGIENVDMSLVKNFRLGSNEARRLQFRLEAYNALNHTQFTSVDNNARFDSTVSKSIRSSGNTSPPGPPAASFWD